MHNSSSELDYKHHQIAEANLASITTGGLNQARFLYGQLKNSMMYADQIDIIVAFLMESGVKMILRDLKSALSRGAKIRILTGNYLGITHPSALYMLKRELGNKIDLRFYNDSKRSFHPKAYIFHYGENGEIYIGSSNVSRSALTSGIEWNYRFTSELDKYNFNLFYETFEDLFNNHSIIIDDEELKKYSKSWHRPAALKDLTKYDNVSPTANSEIIDSNNSYSDSNEVATNITVSDANKQLYSSNITELFEPRGAQIEALYALENSRMEGATKGLVQAATGIGKTYLAAFDSISYKRVLFVAHREEILNQAAISFRNVRHSEDYGFFRNSAKDIDKSVIFASVYTLGKEKYLTSDYFSPDYFDYIVIDEFHHAVNDGYLRIMEYFKPKFMLGLTATPERMDGKNIYALCDYNVVYEISLKEGINKGMLVPFRYYGIYDETNYENIKRVNGKYDENELSDAYLSNNMRYDLIFKSYKKYKSKCALGFCCSRAHAEAMAKEFSLRGIKSAAVYSDAHGKYSMERNEAIQKLRNGELKIIFSVDMFNEGTDITELDMVMFLRPTESPIVFLQQLGRGLRLSKGKKYLNVLDFIGNYEKAGNSALLLCGSPTESPIVFLQQLGRGLRLSKGKKYLNVLDFIGNYEKAGNSALLLCGSSTQSLSNGNGKNTNIVRLSKGKKYLNVLDFIGNYEKAGNSALLLCGSSTQSLSNGNGKNTNIVNVTELDYPDDCIVDFDFRLIDLFEKLNKKKLSVKEKINSEFYRIKDELNGKAPTRMELFSNMDGDIYELCLKNTKENPFKHYLDYLHELGELDTNEEMLYNSIGREFLALIETTNMSKIYKMPVLYAFYNHGNVKLEITAEDALKAWKEFFNQGTNWKDVPNATSKEDYLMIEDKKHLAKIKDMPVKFLKKSGGGFFVDKDGYLLAIKDEVKEAIGNPAFAKHMKDILDYRVTEYYRSRYIAKQ